MTTTKRCTRCAIDLNNDRFYYNGKDHTYCFACAEKRTTAKNKCQTCGIRAIYNIPGETNGISCKKHSTSTMVDVKNLKCIKCQTKQPNFNKPGETKALYCAECKEDGMIDVKHPKCIKCQTKQPSFNKPGETKRIYCADCAEPNMVDILNIKCIKCQTKRPSFNKAGETKALYCADCKEPNMVDVKSPKCIKCQTKVPSFNKPGENKALYCSECKEDGMIDVKHPKCIKCQTKQPSFNKAGETKALYCADCAEPNMVDVKSFKCIKCQTIRPVFNKPGETKALYCAECAEPNMVDVKSFKCIKCQTKQPVFNKAGETKGLYCAECAEPNMVDVKSPKCQNELCKKRASYGIPCNAPVRCAQHKEAGMIIRPRGKCHSKNCNNVAQYGVDSPIYCFTHKTSNDIILVEQTCQECGKIDVLFNGKCVNFCCAGEIDKKYKKNQKLKEKRILGILRAEYKKPTEYNIRVDRDCGGNNREEKEIGYDFGTHKLFIEVDENQHKSYCVQREIGRMKNIYHAEGGIPVIFIRYNPDNFTVGGKRHNLSQAKREEILIKWCKYYEDNIPESPLVVNYLFYDDWVPGKSEEYNIDPYNHECYRCNCGKEFWVKSMYNKHIECCENN